MNNPFLGAKFASYLHFTIITLVKRNSGIFYEHRCAGKFAGAIVRRIINNNIGIITVLSLSEDRM